MSQSFTKGIPIETDGALSANSDGLIPSQKAVKTYVDNGLLTKQATLTPSTTLYGDGSRLTGIASLNVAIVNTSIVQYFSQSITSLAKTAASSAINRLDLMPFIPASDIVITGLALEVITLTVGGLAKLLVYDNSGGKPNNLLIASTGLDCSTIGLKTFATSYTFLKGTIYWIGIHTNDVISFRSLPVASLIPLSSNATNNSHYTMYRSTAYTYGSEPATGFTGTITSSIGTEILLKT